jgi:hypothetical protein
LGVDPGYCQLYLRVKKTGFSHVLKHILLLIPGALLQRLDCDASRNCAKLPD